MTDIQDVYFINFLKSYPGKLYPSSGCEVYFVFMFYLYSILKGKKMLINYRYIFRKKIFIFLSKPARAGVVRKKWTFDTLSDLNRQVWAEKSTRWTFTAL